MATSTPRGRPRRHAEFEDFFSSLPIGAKRPSYLQGIGIARGKRRSSAYVKITLHKGGEWQGRRFEPGASPELRVGYKESFTWDELLALRDDLQRKADRGEPLEERQPATFEAWAMDWLGRAQGRQRGYGTSEIHVRVHLLPFFGAMRLPSIRVTDVNRWQGQQLGNGASPATVKRQFNTLRAILNDALRSGEIERNPCTDADAIRGIVPRQRFLTMPETLALFSRAEATVPWLYDFLLWALHSGMRKGEILALRWEDIREIAPGHCMVNVRHGKADRPRFVPCTPTMLQVLTKQRDRQKPGDSRVFPIAAITLKRRWEALRGDVGLRDVNIHDVRRTHAAFAAANGVDLRTLADRLGHADLSMLQRVYAPVIGATALDAAHTIERVFTEGMQRAASAIDE